jgi:predicted nucleic acid-binding protein
MAALIREAIDRDLERDDEDAKWERAMAVIGKFRSNAPDVSERPRRVPGRGVPRVSLFVDTSGLFAALAVNDPHHEPAAWFADARARAERLVTHNYVVVEIAALARSRLGDAALPALFDGLLASVRVMFVEESLHRAAVAAHLGSPSKPSLVDQVSFRVMRDRGLRTAFAFDEDFGRAGFETVP